MNNFCSGTVFWTGTEIITHKPTMFFDLELYMNLFNISQNCEILEYSATIGLHCMIVSKNIQNDHSLT